MIGHSLFRRFMVRFLIGLGIPFLIFSPLVQVFQKRVVAEERLRDLRQEAIWAARHTSPGIEMKFANAWRSMHSNVRVTFFDRSGALISDSHAERDLPDVAALRRGEPPVGSLAVVEETPHGSWLVVSRPEVPGFLGAMHWGIILAAVLMVVIAYLLLYPLVRSISTTLNHLGEMAEDVAAGQLGKTLQVKRADELGALVEAFNGMSYKLAESERLSVRLLHDVSHELRSPLGRIRVMAESSVIRPEDAETCARGIGQEVELLDRLVEDLLQAARTEADGPRQCEDLSLLSWAKDVLGRFGRRAMAAGIQWKVVLPAVDHPVRADAQRIEQAVGNLVDNAIHALEGASEPCITISIEPGEDSWTIAVADNGPGIPEDDLPHVFRRFYRVGGDRARDRGGVGLGLSLVRAIAAAHGGEARIESEQGSGSTVRLELPNQRTSRA